MENAVPTPVEYSGLKTPFFLVGKIPFPQTDFPQKENAGLRNELMGIWEQAGESFTRVYQNPSHGKPIRDALERRIDYEHVTLADVGKLVGVNKPSMLRKVRAALQVGQLISRTDIGVWSFSEVEIVQLMVGLIGRKYRYNYNKESQDLDYSDPDFQELD